MFIKARGAARFELAVEFGPMSYCQVGARGWCAPCATCDAPQTSPPTHILMTEPLTACPVRSDKRDKKKLTPGVLKHCKDRDPFHALHVWETP